jgi:hypothetical protein
MISAAAKFRVHGVLDSHTLFWEHVETLNLGKSGANMRAVGDASSTRRLVGYLMPARMP